MVGYNIKYRNSNKDKLYAYNLSGGELIGIGSSGCVFKPSIYNIKNKKIISKIYYSENFKDDLLLDAKLAEIDPLAKYHIKLISFRELDMSVFTKKDLESFKKCRIESNGYDDTLEHKFFVAEYDYGGESIKYLGDRILTRASRPLLYKLFRNIIEGLYYFYENGICHNDVHIGNIVFDKNTTRLIDFSTINNKCNPLSAITDLVNALDALLYIINDKEKVDKISNLMDLGKKFTVYDENNLTSADVYDYYNKIITSLWL